MKLRNRHDTPIGGFVYDDPILGKRIATSGSFDKLVRTVIDRYLGASIPIPNNIEILIEDDICQRQPAGKCYYTRGLGDGIAQAVGIGARVIDRVIGTKLESKAKKCGGCARRRARLNQLTS